MNEIIHGRWAWLSGQCKCEVCHLADLHYQRNHRKQRREKELEAYRVIERLKKELENA